MAKILMVCLGNICRSPMAEGVMRKKIYDYKLNATVDSAGTISTHVGESPDHRAQKKTLEKGIDISSLRGRKFKVSDFDNFDLIYVMDKSNYTDVISLAKNESEKQKVVMILNTVNQGKNQPVPDPYWGGDAEFESCYQLLNNACEIIAKSLSLNEKR